MNTTDGSDPIDLASRRMNTDASDSRRMNTDGSNSIDPALTGLGASRKSYHQPIFTSGSQRPLLTDATSAAPDDESGTSAGPLNQVTLHSTTAIAAQDFRSHASSAASSAAATAAQDCHSHASSGTQTQALATTAAAPAEAPPINKRPKERTAATDPGFDSMIDGELTPHASPAPKRPKQGAMKGANKPKSIPASGSGPVIRKSLRKKH